jgi:cephalosporin hydroxylase
VATVRSHVPALHLWRFAMINLKMITWNAAATEPSAPDSHLPGDRRHACLVSRAKRGLRTKAILAAMSVGRLPAQAKSPPDVMRLLSEGGDQSLASLWRWRVELHGQETYAGVRMSKFPEDLRTYEKILWERAPRVVVEIGVQFGGSTLWLRDRLFDFQRYRTGPAPLVIAVDIDLSHARKCFEGLPPEGTAGIELLEGDVTDDAVMAAIREAVPPDAEILVIEDAQHEANTTLRALNGLAPLVRAGGYYMVEDTCVDIDRLRVDDDWPRGAGLALDEWLRADPLGRRFRRRPDLQPYGLTCHPGGLIQRLADL